MKKITYIFIILLCASTPFLLANPVKKEIDPEKILSEAANAMKYSKTIHYSATHEYLGARSAVWASIEGDVYLKNLMKESNCIQHSTAILSLEKRKYSNQ